MRVFLLLLVVASSASAQAPRLVLREAFVGERVSEAPDSAALERTVLPGDGTPVYLGSVLLPLGPGSLLAVSVDVDAYSGAPLLLLSMAPREAAALEALTEAHAGDAMALVLDGRVLIAPTIYGSIPNGKVQITGAFTVAEIKSLAASIRGVSGVGGG